MQSSDKHEKGGSKRDLLTPKTSGFERVIAKTKSNVSRETKQKLLPIPGTSFGEILLKDIIPNKKQPRKYLKKNILNWQIQLKKLVFCSLL